MIGSNSNTLIRTVFGEKPHLYCDFTASGKSLTFIEDYLQSQIMPLYANTHSMQSRSGKQTTNAREEARGIIKRACNVSQDDHAVIFAGTGSTAAVNLLIGKLKIK
jgi:selenocysteine lyase/cysteine desulfurase